MNKPLAVSKPPIEKQAKYQEKDNNGHFSLRSNYQFIASNFERIQKQIHTFQITEEDLAKSYSPARETNLIGEISV